MGKFYTTIGDHHKEFIESQHLFFVSTAPLDGNGHINLSPKGLDSFRILSGNKVFIPKKTVLKPDLIIRRSSLKKES